MEKNTKNQTWWDFVFVLWILHVNVSYHEQRKEDRAHLQKHRAQQIKENVCFQFYMGKKINPTVK